MELFPTRRSSIRINRMLYELFNDMDVAKLFRWLGWMKTLLRDEGLMRRSAVIGGRDDCVRDGNTRLKKP